MKSNGVFCISGSSSTVSSSDNPCPIVNLYLFKALNPSGLESVVVVRLGERSQTSGIVTRSVSHNNLLFGGALCFLAEELLTFSPSNLSHPKPLSCHRLRPFLAGGWLPCWHIWEAGTTPAFLILSYYGAGSVQLLGLRSHLLAAEPETNPIDTFLISPNSLTQIWTCAQMDRQWKSHCFKISVDGVHFFHIWH